MRRARSPRLLLFFRYNILQYNAYALSAPSLNATDARIALPPPFTCCACSALPCPGGFLSFPGFSGLSQEGESEESGGGEWEGKEGWELSEERLERLRGRLATLRVLKFERSTEIVGLVVECQKLFRRLCPPVENPLQTKVRCSNQS